MSSTNPGLTITASQFQQFLTQFAQLKTQFGEQQQLNQQLLTKVNQLESNASLQHNITLAEYETKLEEYFYLISQSPDDVYCQYQLDLLNLISLRVGNVDYAGAALRDLFQLRRGGVIPHTISTITVGDLIKWCQKRLSETTGNFSQQTYYRTLLNATHHDHPLMQSIHLSTLTLNAKYFPHSLHLWAPTPPTPIEYSRLLIAIAYDLPFCETAILPLITHFGYPVSFPKLAITAPSPPPQTMTLSAESPRNKNKNTGHGHTTSDPFFSLGYSTHIPGLLYAPLWFGVLSRESFRESLHDKPQVDGHSFVTSQWFSILCRAGYVFDQIARIICGFNMDGFYPSHQAYSTIMPRFFSADEPLTDPSTYPAFGNKCFNRLFAFLLFIGSHLAMVHSSLEERNQQIQQQQQQIQQQQQSPSGPNLTSPPQTPTNAQGTPVKAQSKAPVQGQSQNVGNAQSTKGGAAGATTAAKPAKVEVLQPLSLDKLTYPIIRDLYNAAVNGSLDCHSLAVVLKSTQLFNHLSVSERSKSQLTRLFGIFHFKVLAGTVPSWLAKPLLGVPQYGASGSVFEQLCGLGHVDHLSVYFNKNYSNCCDKRVAEKANEKAAATTTK